MIIDCGGIVLRAIEESDLPYLQEMINDPYIEGLTGGGAFPVSLDRQKRWFEGYDQQKELRVIIQVKDGVPIGMIMLTDIDWKNRTAQLHEKILASPEDRYQGDLRDAMMGLLNYAFNSINLNCVWGTVLEHNYLSRKFAMKCGLKEEGVLRDRVFKNGQYCNLIANSITKADFDVSYRSYLEEKNAK